MQRAIVQKTASRGGVVDFSSLVKILGECSTIHPMPALLLLLLRLFLLL